MQNLIKLFAISALLSPVYTFEQWRAQNENEDPFALNYKTLFVYEMNRHGARSHYMKNPDLPKNYWGPGVGEGDVTTLGQLQHLKMGAQRRREYVHQKQLLNPKFSDEQILSLSTQKLRCFISGKYFLHGLFPFQDISFQQDVAPQKPVESVLKDTSFESILDTLQKKSNQCFAGPVIQVPNKVDNIMHTTSCKRVHDYINKDRFNMSLLQEKMINEVGTENYEKTKTEMERYWKLPVKNLRTYFEMIDARTAELYHKFQGPNPEGDNLQRQECFILANHFMGEDPVPFHAFISRMLVPVLRVFVAKIIEDMHSTETPLKYIIFNLHDFQISNLLTYLGYWETYGFQKQVSYASSVRFELMRANNKNYFPDDIEDEDDVYNYVPEWFDPTDEYFLRIVYDGQEIKPKFCKNLYCKMSEFQKHAVDHLFVDLEQVKEYCDSEHGSKFDFVKGNDGEEEDEDDDIFGEGAEGMEDLDFSGDVDFESILNEQTDLI